MKNILKLAVVISIGLMILGLSPAPKINHTTVIPVKGTVTSFLEECDWPTACYVYTELDLNISESPVIVNDVLPFANFVTRNGAIHFAGSGTWDFGDGNTLLHSSWGVWALRSKIGGDIDIQFVFVRYTIDGGTGIYDGAEGSIQLRGFEEWTYPRDSYEARAEGVIRVP